MSFAVMQKECVVVEMIQRPFSIVVIDSCFNFLERNCANMVSTISAFGNGLKPNS